MHLILIKVILLIVKSSVLFKNKTVYSHFHFLTLVLQVVLIFCTPVFLVCMYMCDIILLFCEHHFLWQSMSINYHLGV